MKVTMKLEKEEAANEAGQVRQKWTRKRILNRNYPLKGTVEEEKPARDNCMLESNPQTQCSLHPDQKPVPLTTAGAVFVHFLLLSPNVSG